MKTVRKAYYPDLMEKYENAIEHSCTIEEGAVYIANGWHRPDGLCECAWQSMSPFVIRVARRAKNCYDGWMRNLRSAMISFDDGFCLVSFLLETMDEDAEELQNG